MRLAYDQRAILHDPIAAADFLGQPVERNLMPARVRLVEDGMSFAPEARRYGSKDSLLVDQVVPDLEKTHLGISAYPCDIALHRRVRHRLGIAAIAAYEDRGHGCTRREALQIPLPRP